MSHESARKMWNSDAPNWVDHQHLGSIAPVIESFICRHSAQVLQVTPRNSRIVDLGTGANTKAYFPASAHPRIIGLDFSSEMLRLNPLPQKTVAEMSAPLPFARESFGLVTSFFGLEIFEFRRACGSYSRNVQSSFAIRNCPAY
ncbi:class I SAM-dependent methyltransferase [Candidatus Woesebacteria bacterium]|nr:class I SAM-dependent methyltransferase [Candidatus Woesebacteria bacterium]